MYELYKIMFRIFKSTMQHLIQEMLVFKFNILVTFVVLIQLNLKITSSFKVFTITMNFLMRIQ